MLFLGALLCVCFCLKITADEDNEENNNFEVAEVKHIDEDTKALESKQEGEREILKPDLNS